MKFDARALSDDELVVLESTLRVQLAVTKHVRVQQVTAALGGALLTGGVSSLLACPSIVCSTVLRRKCKRRHHACCHELAARGVALAPVQEVTFAKRALALSIASGLTCCVLGVALDVLVDGAVLQVVSFFFSSLVEDHMASTTTAVFQRHAADLVGRDHVYLVDEPPGLFSRDTGNAPSVVGLGAAAVGAAQSPQSKLSLVDRSRQLWKSASWSYTTQEVQRRVRDAKRAFRHRPSLQDTSCRTSADDSDDWQTLFAASSTSRPGNQDDDDETRRRECATLFGCVIFDAEDASEAAARGNTGRESHVELVRSEAFTLFGDCYVVHVRPADAVDRATLLFPRAESSSPSAAPTEVVPNGIPVALAVVSQVADHTVSDDAPKRAGRQSAYAQSAVFAGDDDACAFWDGMWLADDDDDEAGNQDDDGYLDTEYGIEVSALDGDGCTVESSMLSLNRMRVSRSANALRSPEVDDNSVDGDPFSLFGAPPVAHCASAANVTPAKINASSEPAHDEAGDSYTSLFG